ncbi:MAG TPA: LysM peptidoglycan-binding domain-containing protein [Bacillus sp. (in: firmicutes)]|nr:LysM peptidoglycan-binding domain-containing protein [Bacillus sp. (in: firmicutes)]
MKTAMAFENPNKIGMTREEYRKIVEELKKQNAESKIVKILSVTTQWVKGKLRKVVLVVVLLANGLFASQAFACDEYTVKAGDSWGKLSNRTGFTVEYLKQINGKETDFLKIGETVVLPSMEEYLADVAEGGTPNPSILIKQPPVSKENSRPAAGKDEKHQDTAEDKQIHTVQKGDSLWKIAKSYRTTVETIMKDNGFTSSVLKPGQKIIIRHSQQGNQAGKIPAAESSNTAQSTEEKPAVHNEQTYSVKKGDNLWKIARAHQTTVEKIMKDNQLTSTKLKINQKLVIKHENFKSTTAKMVDIGDPTTVYLTKEDGKELILQIPYGREWEFQLLRGKKINVTYVEHQEGVGKLVQYK